MRRWTGTRRAPCSAPKATMASRTVALATLCFLGPDGVTVPLSYFLSWTLFGNDIMVVAFWDNVCVNVLMCKLTEAISTPGTDSTPTAKQQRR